MTTSAEWLALAEKARKAKGPDSRIDNRAACLLYGWREVMEDIEPYGPVPILIDATGNGPCISSEITAGLDAIVALIEKEFPSATRLCGFVKPDEADSDNPPGAWANIFPPEVESNDGELFFVNQCVTEAAAYVASFCLAKAAQAKENDNG